MSVACTAKVIYVDGHAQGVNDGSSWANAFWYLQDALAAAKAAEKPVEIRVAGGVYRPDQGAMQTSGDRTASFRLANGVVIRGGYGGRYGSDPNVRNLARYTSVLTGDLAGDDMPVSDPCDLLAEPSRADNSYCVVVGSDTDATAVLDGFTIAGGNSPYDWEGETAQGDPLGLGAGMFIHAGSPRLIDCTFDRNAAARGGGGLYSEAGSSPVLTGCAFKLNFAIDGGGIMIATGRSSWPEFTGCTFVENQAEGAGGGICCSYGEQTVTSCIFIRNIAEQGGAISLGNTKTTMKNCIFAGNRVDFECDGYCSPPNITGAAICWSGSSLVVTQCTFSGNSASEGHVITWSLGGVITLANCILWDSSPEISVVDDLTKIEVTYSDVRGGWPGEGNIDLDPCFAQLAHWDLNGTPEWPRDDFWVEGDYHLKSQAGRWDPAGKKWVQDQISSPCIDAGDPSAPVGDEPQPNNGRINMGAYGGTAEASKS
jgi:predicted outer membrane repeat protein